MDDERRRAKEAWVTGHSGGPMLEVAVISAVSVAGHLLYQSLLARRILSGHTERHFMRDLAVEYAVLVAPSIVAISFPEWNVALVLGLSMLGFIVLFSLPNTGKLSTNEHPFANLKALPPVLAYRSTMMLLTCASILAVDFASFPRRFAKCEDFGTSLMDMGVGSFVFSNGLVSGRPKPEKDTQNKDKKPSRGGLLSVLRSSLPVFFLGVLRGISVRGANYQTHSSEYGLHWNFFVTLGMVAIGAGLGREVERVLGGGKRFPVGFWTVLGVLISLAHQHALSNLGLGTWVTDAPRSDFLSANKEGISSVPGYLAIYFASLDVGRFALGTPKDGDWWAVVRKTAIWSAGLWTLFVGSRYWFDIEVARKTANLSYFLWVSAFNTIFLALYFAVDLLIADRLVSAASNNKGKRKVQDVEFPEAMLLGAVSRNQLGVFLIANLLTGAVNLSIDTLAYPISTSVAIVVIYMLLVAAVACIIDQRGLRLRFWSD